MQAIARIAEDQKMRAAFGSQMPSASPNSTRTLPSGFIHGGNQRVDSQAEVLRLSATVDSLNSKLTSQSERLQRTEASLVRANRSMTSERATSNARLLRMQTEVKDLRSREATIRESVLAQAHREAQKPASVFGEAAKRAEEYDSKLASLEQAVKTVSEEKNTLETRISTISIELQHSVARAEAAEAKASENGEVAELSELVQSTTVAKDELAGRLADTEARHACVLSQLDAAKAEAECSSTHCEARELLKTEVDSLLEKNNELQLRLDEILNTYTSGHTSDNTDTDTDGAIDMPLETLKSRLQTADAAFHTALCDVDGIDGGTDPTTSKGYKRIGKLAKERHRLQSEISKRHVETPNANGAMEDAVMAIALRAELDANHTGLRVVGNEIGCSYSDEDDDDPPFEMARWAMEMSRAESPSEDEDDDQESTACTIRFQSNPCKLQTQNTRGTHVQHPVTCRLETAMNRAGHGKRMASSCGVNPMSGCRIGRAQFNTCMTSNPLSTTGDSPVLPPDVAALIEAVSKDISDRCIRQRHAYLSASGMNTEDIEAELARYS